MGWEGGWGDLEAGLQPAAQPWRPRRRWLPRAGVLPHELRAAAGVLQRVVLGLDALGLCALHKRLELQQEQVQGQGQGQEQEQGQGQGQE